MTDEEKKSECCGNESKCCKMIAKFFFKVGAVFLGTLLAILVAAALLKPPVPPCPCGIGPKGPCPLQKMERQVPHFAGEHQKGPHHFGKKWENKRPDRPLPPKTK